MDIHQNQQLKLAYDFVQHTNKNIFLTGKAGTGKTTFLHNLKKVSLKRMIVVAPTGVAAINAGGVTIHSFFQMPFGPFIPEHIRSQNPSNQLNTQPQVSNEKKFNKNKIHLIKSLDLLVIDEISMVRADLLDGIDEVLRRYRDKSKPFGGVQLLMIGDLHQLSPVVKDDEWNILKDYYKTVYFFSSKALQKTEPISIELKHIYRQSEKHFINMLGEIRENKVSRQTLHELNQRYFPDFKSKEKDGYITLTTHNATAQKINQSKLDEIPGTASTFTAIIKDDFPGYSFPTEEELSLKVGAQVMFIKNDSSHDKLYYNGKIGKITRFEDDIIFVKCPTAEIPVEHEVWENIRYSLNPDTKEIEETILGSFTQYPLKLAWAITIHKSQGLTFEKAIVDANAAFAFGQVYVALSRCTSFEGLVLLSPIVLSCIKNDKTISEFSNNIEQNAPGETQLLESKASFQQSLLNELFDFSEIKKRFYSSKKIVKENLSGFDVSVLDTLNEIESSADRYIYEVAEKFNKQLEYLLFKNSIPEENAELQERITKACAYFIEKIENNIYNIIQDIDIETDNKVLKKSIVEALEQLEKEIFLKLSCMKASANGFNTINYLRARANSEIDFKSGLQKRATKKMTAFQNIEHTELYAELKRWRNNLAEKNNLPAYMILPHKSLIKLLLKLPVSSAELLKIKGIGKVKVKQFGEDILSIISNYCEKNNVEKSQLEIEDIKPKKPKTIDTKKTSFDLFKAGKSIEEIAKERSFATSTINEHLAYYVGLGEIDVLDLVEKEKVDKIFEYAMQNQVNSLSQVKEALDESITYEEIRLVIKHLSFLEKDN